MKVGSPLVTLLQETGAQGQNRTGDTRIFSPVLYQLSYLGVTGRSLSECLVPEKRIELPTVCLRSSCSTAELLRREGDDGDRPAPGRLSPAEGRVSRSAASSCDARDARDWRAGRTRGSSMCFYAKDPSSAPGSPPLPLVGRRSGKEHRLGCWRAPRRLGSEAGEDRVSIHLQVRHGGRLPQAQGPL